MSFLKLGHANCRCPVINWHISALSLKSWARTFEEQIPDHKIQIPGENVPVLNFPSVTKTFLEGILGTLFIFKMNHVPSSAHILRIYVQFKPIS